VAEIVKALLRETGPLEETLEAMGEAAAVQRRPAIRRKHQIVVDPIGSEYRALFGLAFTVSNECLRGDRWQNESTAAALGLGLLELYRPSTRCRA